MARSFDMSKCFLRSRDKASSPLLHSSLVIMLLIESFIMTRITTSGVHIAYATITFTATLKSNTVY
jgi:hypothetical protein